MSLSSAWSRAADRRGIDTGAVHAADNNRGGSSSLHESVYVRVTSTSTILVQDESGSPVSRMFGVGYEAVAGSFNYSTFGAEDTQTSRFGSPSEVHDWGGKFSGSNGDLWGWITYIESYVSDGFFDLNVRPVPPWDHTESWPFNDTRIPAHRWALGEPREDADFDFQPVSYATGTGELSITSWPTLSIVYKDPQVFRVLEGGAAGWWMLTSRYRTDVSEETPNTAPGLALGDLVAWWSPTADFRSDEVIGPLRIVACTECITSGGAVVSGIRFWVGTAGAVVVPTSVSGETEDSLFVYYVVQKDDSFLADDVADGVALDALLASIGVFEGVWLRKITLTDLADALANHEDYTDEREWMDLPTPTPIVAGTTVGRVQVWTVADLESRGASGSDIETLYQDTAGASIFWADPVPALGVATTTVTTPWFEDTHEEPVLALFLAAINPPGGELATAFTGDVAGTIARGFIGAWMAVAIYERDVAALGLTFGLAFTVRADGGGQGIDKIAGEGLFHDTLHGGDVPTLRLDPDPVTPSGDLPARVYLGESAEAGTRELGLYEASYEDVFRGWNDP